MNLRQLEAFRATMRSGSITEAARMMHISQPSVSRLVADLERAVGFPLFLRSGRGLTPTAQARRFHEGVEGMYVGIGRLRDLAETIRTTQPGIVSIATIQSIATFELSGAVAETRAAHPEARFMIQSRNTPAILSAVQMRQFDLGVVGRQPPYHGVEVLHRMAAPYVCLIPEDHALAGCPDPLDLEEAAEAEEFVTFGGAFPDDMMSMEAGLSERLRAGSRLSSTNVPVAASLAREAGILAIADPFSAEQAVRLGGMVYRPIRQDLSYHVAIVAPGRAHLTPVAEAVAAALAARIDARAAAIRARIA